jgi:hypothetical protein
MAKCGPKPLTIDWQEFDALCAVQCTLAEIALKYDVSEDTIERAVQKQWHMRFADYFRQKKAEGIPVASPQAVAIGHAGQRHHARLARQAVARAE